MGARDGGAEAELRRASAAGDPTSPAHTAGHAGSDCPSAAGQAAAAGRDDDAARSERGAGEEVLGLQEGAGRYPAQTGGDQVGGERDSYHFINYIY